MTIYRLLNKFEHDQSYSLFRTKKAFRSQGINRHDHLEIMSGQMLMGGNGRSDVNFFPNNFDDIVAEPAYKEPSRDLI